MKNYTDQSDSRRDGGQSREQSSESKPESAREKRPSGDRRDDRPYRSRPTSDRRERPAGDRRERPAGERRERPAGERRDDRPFRSRPSSDRPDRERSERRERPAGERRERPAGERRDDRPFRSRQSSDRPDRERSERRERPAGDRRERPTGERRERPTGDRRDDRPFRSRPSSDRPDRERSKRRERPAGDRRERSEGDRRKRSVSDRRDDRPFRSRPSSDRVAASEYTPKPRRRKALEEEGIRLNKFIANSGVCSRREADEYITSGLISVNGQIITELGTKIQSSDDVRFNGERLKGEEKVYILMNKPKDFVTTVTDPNAEKTVMDLIAGKCSQRVFPVGRLDKATTGVLLMTNDGEIAEKLSHPSNLQKKIYHVFLDKNLSGSDFKQLIDGVVLEDGMVQADALSYIEEDKSQIGLEIHSGRNKVVRRMFEQLGYRVKKLDRVFYAGLTKKNLRRGQWRFLTEQEISMLKMGAYE